MNRYLAILCALLIGGCQNPPPEKIVARVNNYTITQEEFDEAYKNSSNGKSRQEFLNSMIDQKLILLDAQAHGLDRDKDFLKMVENFWQQSLLTLSLKEKNQEGVNIDKWLADLRDKSTIQINEESVQ